jgi:hypothetical protein
LPKTANPAVDGSVASFARAAAASALFQRAIDAQGVNPEKRL